MEEKRDWSRNRYIRGEMSHKSRWFTDDIINIYVKKLRDSYKNDTIGYFDCYVTSVMAINTITNDARSMRKWCEATKKICDLETKKFVIIPFQADGNHWVVCVVIPTTHHILLYDSFCRDIDIIDISQLHCIDKVKDFLHNYGAINGVEHFRTVPWLTVPIPFKKTQSDKYTCGTFVLMVAHLFTIETDGIIPTYISINNVQRIHGGLLDEFRRTKDVELLDHSSVISQTNSKRLDLSTIARADVLKGSFRGDGVLDVLHYPMLRDTSLNKLFEKKQIEKNSENINVMGEKRSVYSQKLEFAEGSYITLDKFCIDDFGVANIRTIELVAEKIMASVKHDVMRQYKKYVIDMFCDFRFGGNFFILERYIMRYIFSKSMGQCIIRINIAREDISCDTIVPFHDYDHTRAKNSIRTRRDLINDSINRNDALHALMDHFGERARVKTWKNRTEWMENPDCDSTPSVRILILGNEEARRDLSEIRDIFLLSRCSDEFSDPKDKRVLVSVLLEIEKDELYTQILFRKDNGAQYHDDGSCAKIVTDYTTIKKMIYAETLKERIVTFYSQLKGGILCDTLRTNKKQKLVLF